MNKKGFDLLLERISVGDSFSCTTKDGSYSGTILEIHNKWLVLDEYEPAINSNVQRVIDYSRLLWHSAEDGLKQA